MFVNELIETFAFVSEDVKVLCMVISVGCASYEDESKKKILILLLKSLKWAVVKICYVIPL